MAKKSFIGGAIILMLAGLAVRILGFYYRIFLSNLIGAEGMGLFQIISPVYSLVILTLTSGISIAVSKMVAEEAARNHTVNLRRITSCALALVVTASMGVSLLIYLKIDFITGFILKDTRTYYALLLLIPTIPAIAAASAFKGYFYGIQDVVPTAYSQIVEQIVRIGIVMATAGYFVNLGLEYACALATVGMALGEISNMAVLFIMYRARKRREGSPPKTGIIRKRAILRSLLGISLPVSSNRFITSIMNTVELILIPRMLEAGGLDHQSSLSLYGKLSGMAMPLVYFPSVITFSLATTLVPAISEAMSVKNNKSVNHRISRSIQIALITGFIFSGIFVSYPNEIGNMIYRRENIGELLYMLAFTCVVIYLSQTLSGVLNGMGKQGILLRNAVIGYGIRIGFVCLLVPAYGIQSYIWGLVVSFACVCILNLATIIRMTGLTLDFRNWLLKPGLIECFMLATAKYIYSFFGIFSRNVTANTLLAVIAHFLIATAFMFALGVLHKDEITRLAGFGKRKKALKI